MKKQTVAKCDQDLYASAHDLYRSSFPQHLRLINHLHKTGDKVRCGTCKFFINFDREFQNNLLTGEHLARVARRTT